MMEKQKYIWVMVVAILFAGMGVIAQDIDEDSLLAEEEVTLSDSIEGDLPTDDAGQDDLLADLLSDDSGSDLDSDLFDADVPLDALADEDTADDSLADALGDLKEVDMGDAIEGLDAKVPAVEEPAVEDLDLGGAVEDLGLDSEKPGALIEPAADEGLDAMDTDESLDDLLGELAGEEPTADLQPVVKEPALIEEPKVVEEPAIVEEKGVDTAEAVPEFDDSIDMDALVAELAGEAEADLGIKDVPEVVEPAPAVDIVEEPAPVEVVEEPAAPVEIVEEPAAPVEIVEEPPPAVEYVDNMAIDDDIFKGLADEAKTDIAVGNAAAADSDELPAIPVLEPESDVDDLIESLADEAESGLALPEEPIEEPVAVVKEPEVIEEELPAVTEEPVAVEAPVEVPVEIAAPVATKSPEVSAFETAERLKRIAAEAHAIESVQNAEKELAQKRYVPAIILFDEALKYLPNREDLVPWRDRARKGHGGASYLRALSLERMEEYEKAYAAAIEAVKFDHKSRYQDAVKRIKAKIDAPPPPPPTPPRHRQDQPEYIQTQKEINAWLKRGREAFLTGEYERAILNFESVLARDPENKEAMRLKRNASQKRVDRSLAERDGTRVSMMTDVADAWSQKRKYGEYETPIDDLVGRGTTTTSIEDKKRSDVISKMENIRIPEVDFRQANIRDVVKFLHDQSIEFDPSENPDERKGVNIILKLGASEKAEAVAEAPDPWGAEGDGLDAGAGAAGGETFITFSALDITLKEALDIVVDIANLKYLIRGNIVKIMPKNAATSDIEHRMYNVLSSAIGRLEELSAAVKSSTRGSGDFMGMESTGDLGGQEVDLKVFFAEMGVEWPEKSSIKYVRGLGKLVVANTLENLTVFEKVLKVLNVVPYQIEIEARFVEVAQTDIDSLGLEWMLNDNWEVAEKKSDAGLPLGARERVIVEENAGGGGFTRGNRFITDLTGEKNLSDDLMRFTSILTNPELTVVLHAMQQQGHSDLLSAPKITTQSGQQATIKVVTEYIYPTEYTLIEARGSGGQNAGIAPPAVEPGSFETREVGVILDVLPEVSPDGQMINLTLSPEVVTEPIWRDYGYDYFLGNMGGGVVTTHLRMEQPFFHSRSLQTNLLIYNGATVVMGGMITEVREDVDDKIPILGDIPILGHLFRSRYEASEKRNLLIFVTARLVDPSGRPLDSEKFGIDGTIAEKIATSGEDSGE